MTDPDLDAVLAQMWAGFRPLAQSRVEVLEGYLSALQAGEADDGRRADAASAAHKLAGALGSYGRDGSDEASRLEVLLREGGAGPRDPLQVAGLVRSLRASVDPLTAPGNGRRVLLVDDAADVRMLLQLALEGSGFEVLEAEDGRTGLEAARATPPDVVLLDVQLPDLDGPGVLTALRAEPATATVPVVFLTAAPPSGDGALLALGARGVLRKPFDLATIAGSLASLL